MTALPDHRESRDAYAGELFRHGDVRVALCRDGIQWLLQRRRARFPAGGAAWDTLRYCTTRKALARLHRALVGRDVPELDALPERPGRIPRPARSPRARVPFPKPAGGDA